MIVCRFHSFFLTCLILVVGTCKAWIPRSSSTLFNNGPLTNRRSVTTSSRQTYCDRLALAATPRKDVGNGRKYDGDDDKKRRMAVVRSLQMSYYLSAERQAQRTEGSDYHPELDAATGILKNLPLWRVQWTELPGRSNVLNVHEPIYTNMFEKILYGPKPWLFGHLYLPGGSKNLKKSTNDNEDPYSLKTWQDEISSRNKDVGSENMSQQRSAVVGCLLKISDYRRMADGRLLLLVHGVHRFVVSKVQQQVPYSIADVQLLPDVEEIDDDPNWIVSQTEADISIARAMAVEESIRFQEYEYDVDHKLPIPNKIDLDISDIGSTISRVLPFCPYSKTLDPPSPTVEGSRSMRAWAESPYQGTSDFEDTILQNSEDLSKANNEVETLEHRLISGYILNDPPTHPEVLTPREKLTVDELEYELWLAINDFLITSRTPVSPVLLGLLPPRTKFPSHVVVESIAAELATMDKTGHDFVAVPPTYPELRRQQRLSYCAAQLMEQTEWGKDLRQRLLETPSIKARLRLVLERFDLLHSATWGEFQ